MHHVQPVYILDPVDDLLEKFAGFLFLQSLVLDNLVEQFATGCILDKQK